ncbi:hypothetical protein NDU88_000054 [Pleurodeles waltl]|uniref:Alpha-tectorin n=1 Tax=Pleurodeles waltl TaxID=8319 RepID=A0AAV7SV78_PLEWA|nr:hypothetical protein NDU88_000054 [Pleurodeles waltl]
MPGSVSRTGGAFIVPEPRWPPSPARLGKIITFQLRAITWKEAFMHGRGRILYPFGQSMDSMMPHADDASTDPIAISGNFTLYGVTYTSLYVGTNGLLSFLVPVSAPSPQVGGTTVVAVFWADVDIRVAGEIYYRQSTDPNLLQNATSDINTYFPGYDFNATWVFIATWDRVAYYASPSPPSMVNTFQVVLISGGALSFVLLNYGSIQWTWHSLEAGFQNATANQYYTLTVPGSTALPSFPTQTNVNVTGRYAFRVDTFRLPPDSCLFQGVYVPSGTIFWKENACQTQCQCTNTSQVTCQPQPCSGSCSPAARFFTCLPIVRSTCLATGGSLFTTFSARYFRMQTDCTYVLSQSCSDGSSLPSYLVEVRNGTEGGALGAWVRQVYISVYNTGIAMHAGNTTHVLVNGFWSLIPMTLIGGKVNVSWSGLWVALRTDFGLDVTYDGFHHVAATFSARYNYSTCGLCSSFNGTTGNASSVNPLSDGSGTTSGGSAGTQCTENTTSPACIGQNISLYSGLSHCGIMASLSGPFASCVPLLPPEAFVRSCINDLCGRGGDHSVLCLSIAIYVEQCQARGIPVVQWRTSTTCNISCAANSHYELCGGRCQDSCSVSTEPTCLAPCSEGCFCNTGFVRSGNECVSAGQCGCSYDGRYYKLGDMVWMSNCTKQCTCNKPGAFNCVSASCTLPQYCSVKGGRLGCQDGRATCLVSGGTHYFTFDGSVAHFQGTCTYEIASTCHSSTQLSFHVTAKNQEDGNVSSIFQVTVSFQASGQQVQLVVGRDKVVQVNGIEVSLPASLYSTAQVTYDDEWQDVRVTLWNDTEIRYNGRNTLIIRVGPQYKNQLCGLCGNFNGNAIDDKVLPDGTRARRDQEFGNSWTSESSSTE